MSSTCDFVWVTPRRHLVLDLFVALALGALGVLFVLRPDSFDTGRESVWIRIAGLGGVYYLVGTLPGIVRDLRRGGGVCVQLTEEGVLHNSRPWPFREGRFARWGDVDGFGVRKSYYGRRLVLSVHGQMAPIVIYRRWHSRRDFEALSRAIAECLEKTQGSVPTKGLSLWGS